MSILREKELKRLESNRACRAYYHAHREEARRRHRKYYLKNRKEIIRKASEKWWKNPELLRKKQNERKQKRIATDPEYAEYIREASRKSYRKRLEWYILRNAKQAKTMEQKARIKLGFAVRNGKIKKPAQCDGCSFHAKLEAHHYDGYKNPFKVLWLCHFCHAKLHRKKIPHN